jgi:hypothetical protein
VRAARDLGDTQVRVAAARDLAKGGILDRRGGTRGATRALALHVSP